MHDVTERLQRLIKPSDRYPFLLLHVGTNDTAKNDLEQITADYVALGRRIKEFEVQVVFLSILPMEVNEWLRRWCRREGFGFFDHGMVFQEGGVLGRDGLHLTKKEKSIFASRLANLVRRALNKVHQEEETKALRSLKKSNFQGAQNDISRSTRPIYCYKRKQTSPSLPSRPSKMGG
ncbi:unnamed protein product [Natator depressus]